MIQSCCSRLWTMMMIMRTISRGGHKSSDRTTTWIKDHHEFVLFDNSGGTVQMIEDTYVYVRDLKLHHNRLGARAASAFVPWFLDLGARLEHGGDTQSSMVWENVL